MATALRYHRNEAVEVAPRSERLAALSLGLFVLVGALATYAVLAALQVRA